MSLSNDGFVEIVGRIGMRALHEIDRPFGRRTPLFLPVGINDYGDICIAVEQQVEDMASEHNIAVADEAFALQCM